MELQLQDQRWHIQVTLSVALTQALLGDLACHDASDLILTLSSFPKQSKGKGQWILCIGCLQYLVPCSLLLLHTIAPNHIVSLVPEGFDQVSDSSRHGVLTYFFHLRLHRPPSLSVGMTAQFQTTRGKEQTEAKLENSGKGGASFLSGGSAGDSTLLGSDGPIVNIILQPVADLMTCPDIMTRSQATKLGG